MKSNILANVPESPRPDGMRPFYTMPKNNKNSKVTLDDYIEFIKKLGIFQTPIQKLYIDNIPVYIKREDVNGNGKFRSASMMLFYYYNLGLLDNIQRISVSGAGNFAYAIKTISKYLGLDIIIHSYVSNVPSSIINKLNNNGIKVIEVNGLTCGLLPGENPKVASISLAFLEEYMNRDKVVYLDQHGIAKPFDSILNFMSFSILGEELYEHIENIIESGSTPIFVHGFGTRGSMLGISYALRRKFNNKILIISHTPLGNGSTYQNGLRHKHELPKAYYLSLVDYIVDAHFYSDDNNVKQFHEKLKDEYGLDVGPSTVGNIYIGLQYVKSRNIREPTIFTIAMDNIYNYI